MGPKKTTVFLKGGYMGFHISLGEFYELESKTPSIPLGNPL